MQRTRLGSGQVLGPAVHAVSATSAAAVASSSSSTPATTAARSLAAANGAAGAGSCVAVGGRGAADSALLAAVRKQIEACEEKVGSQLARMQLQNGRMRDAALSRL